MARSFRPTRRHRPKATPSSSVDELIRQAKEGARARAVDYRARSLALHCWICARGAREFERADLHLLTVHHQDGNPDHNPPDGSNWENLCVYCHEAEHTKNG